MQPQGRVWVAQHLREIKKEAKSNKRVSENTRVLPRSSVDNFRPALSNQPGRWLRCSAVTARQGRAAGLDIAASFADAEANDANDSTQRSHL